MKRKRMLDGLDKDIREHIEAETLENIERGMSPGEAHSAALRKFGNVTQVKEETREVWSFMWFELLREDVRFSFRMMRKSPGFTAVAVLTLALAIGANAVVFSVLNALILRPLDVPHPETLYTIEHSKALALSYPDYLDLRDRNRSFDGLAGYNNTQAGLDTGGNPTRTFVDEVSGNYFEVFGIRPYLGRFFHRFDEHGPNSAPYIVLNYEYWNSRFQRDPGVIGRTVQLNKYPFTIIGVAPPGFHGPVLFFTQDFFVPIVNQEQVEGQDSLNVRGNPSLLMTIGHLKAGATPQQAIGDLNAIGSYLEKTYPKTDGNVRFGLARPSLFGEFGGPPTRAFLTALMLLAGLILLASCANLGSLFAARAADRTREMALRLALGASRGRILRALFTEALLISVMGGIAGLWSGALVLKGLSVWRPVPQFPVHMAVYPDANVYAVALLLTLISGFLFGAAPVRQVLHTDPYQIVKSGSGSMQARRITVRDLLLVLQIAICAVLITSSLVAVRGLMRSLHGDYGFESRNVVLMDTDLAMAGYRGNAVPTMQRRMLSAMQIIPGVKAVGFADRTPLNGSMRWSMVFTDNATDLRPSHAAAEVPMYSVSPGYFRAAGTAMLSGRSFTWHDNLNAPRVAVINQEFARKVFGSVTNIAGRYYKLPDGTGVQVVGIAEGGKYERIGEDPEPAMFFPILQSPSSSTTLLVRANLAPSQVAAAMKSKLRQLDSGLPSLIQTWNKGLGVALFGPRMATISLGVLGVMGAMLSITGIFGIAAYSVSRRMKELGIRIALGAQRKDVLQAALGRAFKLLAFGSAAGLLVGFLASQALAAIVYQATPRDPLVLAGVVLAMASLGLLATWIPARRALSVNPLTLLREE
ncbi:MAG TPA: ABC transporter permease [Bryobacteraceae bacterium]|jgi:predicted permease|nr:ABC transporter permease [Bryobacteraceae bacterium]